MRAYIQILETELCNARARIPAMPKVTYAIFDDEDDVMVVWINVADTRVRLALLDIDDMGDGRTYIGLHNPYIRTILEIINTDTKKTCYAPMKQCNYDFDSGLAFLEAIRARKSSLS